jgi:hypothetical protein
MRRHSRIFRQVSLACLLLAFVIAGCAGPTKLAQHSEQKLANGDIWQAWRLATRALDREPMNPRAKAAAASAGRVISDDWQRRIHALAQVDSMRAAEQVLEFAEFRANAATYTTIAVGPTWSTDEYALRRAAANNRYLEGKQAMAAHRPRAAFDRFHEAERFVPGFRDATKLADGAFEQAQTRVAVLPFAYAGKDASFGLEVGAQWRDALSVALAPPHTRFTHVLGADAVDGRMTVSQLAYLSRDEAVRIGRKCGAQRVVRGAIGPVSSETHIQFFRDTIARRIVEKGDNGQVATRWVEVPIEVVARVRDVTVDVDYEVISTDNGASIVHSRSPRTTRARVVWTSYTPDGDVGDYALVSEAVRSQNPDRARDVETRWKSVCGETTTLQQVLSARRETRGDAGYDKSTLGRFAAGAAFVFLQELPPAQDLALAAVKNGWQPLFNDLTRLDSVDEVDLNVSPPSANGDDQ